VRTGRFAWRSLLNRAFSGANTLARGLFAALFHSDCLLCGTGLENTWRLPMFRTCLSRTHPISCLTGSLCGEPLPGEERHTEHQTCVLCLQSRPGLAKARAYGAYQSELRELIQLLKYEEVFPAAKRWQPRFNHSGIIPRVAPKNYGSANLHRARNVSDRERAAVPGLTHSQRLENIRWAHPSRAEGRAILWVDEILTIGTMASERARVLRNDAQNVRVRTVARSLTKRDPIVRAEADFEDVAQAS